MIKSEVVEEVEPEYPCLKQARSDGEIFLFISEGRGMMLTGESIGHYSTGWAMTAFDPFAGKVTLENL